MPETSEDTASDPIKPAFDEFMKNATQVSDGLSEMISCAMRMQILIMEDTRNMMAEFGEISAAAQTRGAQSGKS